MMKNSINRNVLILTAIWLFSIPAMGQQPTLDKLQSFETQRTDDYAQQLETHLQQWLVDEYTQRAEKAWNRDYSSVAAFVKSVEPNRKRWRDVVKPPRLEPTGDLERKPYPPLAELKAEWITIPLGGLNAEALFVVPANTPKEKPVPLVIAQHGIGSCPERTFGLLDDGNHYHSYAKVLVENGFAVLAPMNLRSIERRNRIERLCRLAGTTLPGIEFMRMQCLLDKVLKDPRVDADRVGMWGLSLGGLATMFWMPIEPRIKVGVVSAWFNHRRNKMAIPDPRYSCFLETKEEHAFFNGWLTEFTDSDVVSLICPRPLLIQHGKKDRIAHWPQVVEEFEISKTHYEKLELSDRIELDLHEGGHESLTKSGLRFMNKWLKD
jgi:dienelactone hydrolase